MSKHIFYLIVMYTFTCDVLCASRQFVKYEMPPGTNMSGNCAVKALLGEHTVVINDAVNDTNTEENCSDKMTRKITTFKNWVIQEDGNSSIWILPSRFDYGSRIEISFMIPSGSDWFEFCFALRGSGLQLARVCIRQMTGVAIHQYNSEGSTGNQNFYQKLKIGTLYVCIIESQQDVVLVTIGNGVFAELDYVIQPSECDKLTTDIKGTAVPTVTKLTLISA